MKILKLPFLQVLLWLNYCNYFKFHTVIQPSTFKYINIRALFYFLQFIQSCQPDRFWKRHFKSQWHERYVKVSLYPVTGMLSLSQNVCMYVCMWQLTVQRVVYSGLNIGNRFLAKKPEIAFWQDTRLPPVHTPNPSFTEDALTLRQSSPGQHPWDPEARHLWFFALYNTTVSMLA